MNLSLLERNQENSEEKFKKMEGRLELLTDFFRLNEIPLSQAISMCINFLIYGGKSAKLSKDEMVVLVEKIKSVIEEIWRDK